MDNDQLWLDLKGLLEAYADKPEERPETTLYHYTNYNGLEGILKTRKLWLSDYSCLNDTSEIKYALTKVKEIINERANRHAIRKEFVLSDFLRKLIFEFDLFLLKHKFYIISFCQHPNYLPAWRWYANDGAGFAIGFTKEFFSISEEKLKILCHKVHYQPNDFEDLINKFIDRVEPDLASTSDHPRIMIIVFCFIIPILGKLKHEAYQAENEFRLIVSDLTNPEILDTQFGRPESSLINCVPTITYDYQPDHISEIWVGPKCNFQIAKNRIKRILEENNFDSKKITIEKSNIPYKNKD